MGSATRGQTVVAVENRRMSRTALRAVNRPLQRAATLPRLAFTDPGIYEREA